MKQATSIIGGIGFLLLLSFAQKKKEIDHWYAIPSQSISIHQLTGDTTKRPNYQVDPVQMSEQVTFRAYKEYLKSIKKDSSLAYYLTQLPDTSIAKRVNWEKYISDEQYNDYPVLGISWENAMNYCRWKTLKDNKKTIRFIYRLPQSSEWLAAQIYLEKAGITHDFNQHYSDWLINSFDESVLFMQKGSGQQWRHDFTYWHQPSDPLVMKRKLVIGNSFHYQCAFPLEFSFSYYGNHGYRQVAFRLVKEMVPTEDEMDYSSIYFQLLDQWRLTTD